ncbi:hypothetical protein AJ80_07195 [Polytolypa hystricis UAMH7299]|uniref:HIG1 domain-containing protein n=1 Tax=Polytolypa hystricis (strain UAMH7299) TaxID=1447883 RepID=A0A2B7XQS7_POLH7|nr:hypothetical protein AJ80_07195 [Polytolypa hystricis UAMH7299]
MKILTREEEDAHYGAVIKGGSIGGLAGLAVGQAGLMLASRRFSTIRTLTLPMKAFLVTSAGSFTGIIGADHASRSHEAAQHHETVYLGNREARRRQEQLASMTGSDRAKEFFKREKYKIVGLTWIASILGSFMIVNRNKYLSTSQKIVQARVYAQGLSLAVLVAVAGFEIHDQRQGKGLLDNVRAKKQRNAKDEDKKKLETERYQGENMWKEMVEAEEMRLKEKDEKRKAVAKQE